jgi:hypothetical protein
MQGGGDGRAVFELIEIETAHPVQRRGLGLAQGHGDDDLALALAGFVTTLAGGGGRGHKGTVTIRSLGGPQQTLIGSMKTKRVSVLLVPLAARSRHSALAKPVHGVRIFASASFGNRSTVDRFP